MKFILYALLLVAPLWISVVRGEHFFLRDVGTTHRPAWHDAAVLDHAKINPAASFGQPYRGNPNLLLFYPFPKRSGSVEFFVAGHLTFLALGMLFWLRREGAGLGAYVGATTFALSGYVLSGASSMNALATIAWIPWVFLTARSRACFPCVALRIATLAMFSLTGEPVLIGATLLVAIALVAAKQDRRAVARLLLGGSVAFLLTAPIHWQTFLAARESQRVVAGYDAPAALTESLHPARLIEFVLPGFFGMPSRIDAGSWWGYAVSGGRQPYVFSPYIGMTALALILCLGATRGFRTHRGWWILLAGSLLVASAGRFPGAAALWNAIPPLHVLRFPIKALLFTTLAASVLASFAWDELTALSSSAPERTRLALGLAAATLLLILPMTASSYLARSATATWWDPSWRGDLPHVLEWLAQLIALRSLLWIATLAVLFFWIARRRQRWADVVVIGAMVLDLMIAGSSLVPMAKRRPASVSPIVTAAVQLNGRVFERADKDLDTAVYGVRGVYETNDAALLALAQERQAWALSGMTRGLRYAYDRSPDGSYTWRNHVLQTHLEDLPWSSRVKWLRAAGVASVIASSVPPATSGLHAIATDASVGVPVTLFAIDPRLAELRSPPGVRWASSTANAVATFERPDFDEQREIVVEGESRATSAADVRMIDDGADRVVFRSVATEPAIVFLARTYTHETTAFAESKQLQVLPANVHLCAILVPNGTHTITVTF